MLFAVTLRRLSGLGCVCVCLLMCVRVLSLLGVCDCVLETMDSGISERGGIISHSTALNRTQSLSRVAHAHRWLVTS